MVDISQVFPINESFDIQTSLQFDTTILRNDRGTEQRVVNWQSPLRTYNISKKLANRTDIQTLGNFYNLTKGSKNSFLYLDRSDHYAATDAAKFIAFNITSQGVLLPVADGTRTEFQLIKKYTVGDNTHYRIITQPIANTINLKRNGSTVTNWTIGSNGKITFQTPPTGILTADFKFYVPVRLEQDNFDFQLISHSPERLLYSIPQLVLKEVREIPFYYPRDEIDESCDRTFDLDFVFAATESNLYNTESIPLSSGFERQIERSDETIWLSRLGQKNKLNQKNLEILIAFWLCCKGSGCLFNYQDRQYSKNTYPARFNNNTLTYLRRSTLDYYQVNGLELRQFKSGIDIETGFEGLSGNLLTIARVCKIERPDGVIHGFTTHDRDLVIDGTTYKASTAFDPTALTQKVELSVDNLEIKSVIDTEEISIKDLVSGQYSDAIITIAVVDYTDLPDTLEEAKLEQKGLVGEIKLTNSYYVLENLTRAAALLKQAASVKTSPGCRYEFGDSKCKKDLDDLTYNVSVTQLYGGRRSFRISGSIADNLLEFGKVTFTSGENVGITMNILSFNNNIIELFLPTPRAISVNDTLTVVAGCDKSETTCRDTYDNFINFGGEPSGGKYWMPGNDFLLASPVSSD